MDFLGITLAPTLVAVFGLMTALWVVSVVVRDASIVDPVWGLAFVVIAWASWLAAGGQGAATYGLLVPLLVTVWGLRLSAYLAWRNLGKGEDYRYVRMRERFGARFPVISLVVVFWLQAGIAWVVSLPVQATIAAGVVPTETPAPLVVAGVVAWAIGLFFETVGDLQLAAFKRDPANKGKVMDRGLWRYTRHPNYFGDFCVWWGLFLVAASVGAWWTAVGPLLMSVMLIRVSGAGLLEKTIGQRRPGYDEYIRRTSGFFPLPPRD
jgi:steroid 5-alpha reductase family enzyme